MRASETIELRDLFDAKIEGVMTRIEGLSAHIDSMLTQSDRRYTERFDAQDKANRLALDNAATAMKKAEEATNERLKVLNELRAVVNNTLALSMPRVEFDAREKANDERFTAFITSNETKQTGMQKALEDRIDALGTAVYERITGEQLSREAAVENVNKVIVALQALTAERQGSSDMVAKLIPWFITVFFGILSVVVYIVTRK